MGVQNLWLLVAPVGRKIEIESLATKVLAVDASIWLTQFIKAMRDDEGNMIRNAHLIGTFHRVAKLLFYRIRPVFVFDGSTPEIKRRTVARRRRRQEHQAANLRQTAQRILLNRLKLYREEMKKNGGKPAVAPAAAPGFLLPGVTESGKDATGDKDGVNVVDESDSDKEVVETEEQKATSEVIDVTEASASTQQGIAGQAESKSDSESDQELTIDDIDLDTSRLSRIDLDAVFALPAHLQKDMIQRIMRDRLQEVRNQFIPLAGNPEAYSRTQISSFLTTSKLHRRLQDARQKKVQQEMESVTQAKEGETSDFREGRRIASSSDRFFIYHKADERDKASKSEQETEETEVNDLSQLNDVTTHDFESNLHDVDLGEGDDEIFSRIHGRGRKRRKYDEDNVVAKKSLSEFSIGATKEFTLGLGRDQRRKLAVEAARNQLLERQKYQLEEPPLAIEKVRRARAKENNSSSEKKASTGNISIVFKLEDAEALDTRTKDLFPADIFVKNEDGSANNVTDASKVLVTGSEPEHIERDDQAKLRAESDDEDVDWEDVPNVTVVDSAGRIEDIGNPTSSGLAVPNATEEVQKSNSNGIIEISADEEEDDVEWETVHAPVITAKGNGAEDSPVAGQQKDVSDVIMEEAIGPGDMNISQSPDATAQSDSDLDAEEDDLLQSLRREVDEEGAEDDLALLKQEALESAIATASNLTQWAAGAVRRALAAHTRQDVAPSPTRATKSAITNTRFVDLTEKAQDESKEEEKASMPSGHVPNSKRVSADFSQNEATMDVEQVEANSVIEDSELQLAIQQSVDDSMARTSSSSRYLQYSEPSEPAIDVGAIEKEQNELKKLRNRQMRDVEGVNDEMVEEVMELLRLFGVPFLVCPMEAEAQCAALEQLGLVDGIITDDSDIFPFGGQKVYKNIFHNQKFVEAFFADDIEKEFGFTQDEMISLAMLLGSDYTDGVRGIGIVNATEVVTAYPGFDGLAEFKTWVQSFDVAEEALRRQEKKKSQSELDEMTPRERFQYTHASVRRKWELGEAFPNPVVAQAYKNPQVDRSEAKFSWSLPDLAGLRDYCTKTFGWEQSKTDSVLLPLMEQIATFANSRHVQTRIDHFFTTYDDNIKYAKIRSKRLQSAVQQNAKKKAEKTPAASTKRKFTKTKKTTSTLGL
ncbi:hypothetical protein Poli38472_002987 [Pythium oligandrum]|uniref:Uncharacterized protein n=1 Tax=Pythium oligandrum TaxID=41045 RepID=A0A8K1FEW5_PYTOL|nr:hypothetical protein Poli38472_002987 [Pythium oligandrum]|eukprot:TMW57062.1 hypothetical protein Poli38472_002987 [Pythium oligandrum]